MDPTTRNKLIHIFLGGWLLFAIPILTYRLFFPSLLSLLYALYALPHFSAICVVALYIGLTLFDIFRFLGETNFHRQRTAQENGLLALGVTVALGVLVYAMWFLLTGDYGYLGFEEGALKWVRVGGGEQEVKYCRPCA